VAKMSKKKAQKSDWDELQGIPKEHSVKLFEHEFSLEDYRKIQYGLIPEVMEDKWFIYFEDNNLYCHRSWTGFCVYIVEFEVSEKSSQIKKISINRDKAQYSETDDNWDCHFVVYLINLLLLNKSYPYPVKEGTSSGIASLQQWSQVGRAMLKDEY